jgi:hypothetical protein
MFAMTKSLPLVAAAALTAGAFAALPAQASDRNDRVRCTVEAGAQEKPMGEVIADLETKGYKIREMERDHGCYEVEAIDPQGMRVEVDIHPVTGETLNSRRDD